MKKGQVATYIVIGLIIIIIAVLLTYANKEFLSNIYQTQTSKLQKTPQEIEILNKGIDDCLDNLVKENLILIGGKVNPLVDELDIKLIKSSPDLVKENLILIGQKGGTYEIQGINTLYNSSKINIPTIEDIKSQLTLSIKDNIYACKVEDETDESGEIITEKRFNITYKDPKINTQINNKIIITIDWPLIISKDNLNFKKQKYSNSYNLNYNKILSVTNQMITQSMTNHSLCITCINDISYNNSIETRIEYTDKNKFIIYLTDNSSIIDNEPYAFVFRGEL